MHKWIVLFGFLLLPAVAAADRDQEREDLIAIIRELEVVVSVVERARDRHSGHSDSVVFRYDALQQRIATLTRDIRLHIDTMDRVPRFSRFDTE